MFFCFAESRLADRYLDSGRIRIRQKEIVMEEIHGENRSVSYQEFLYRGTY